MSPVGLQVPSKGAGPRSWRRTWTWRVWQDVDPHWFGPPRAQTRQSLRGEAGPTFVCRELLQRSPETRCLRGVHMGQRPHRQTGPTPRPGRWQLPPPLHPPSAQERLPPWQQLIPDASSSSVQHLFVSLLDCISVSTLPSSGSRPPPLLRSPPAKWLSSEEKR